MKQRIKTLVIDSDGAGWKAIIADTTLRGLLGVKINRNLPLWLRRYRWVRKLFGQRYEGLSYIFDWRDALSRAPELDVEICNITNLFEYRRYRHAIATYPLIIILHSAAGDSMSLLLKTISWFQKRRGKLVMFIGNEYDLMAEKFGFLQSTKVDYVCSQLPIDTAQWLYAECLHSRVLALPHALNPSVYQSPAQTQQRTIDIGFRGDLYPYFIGDQERTHLLTHFMNGVSNRLTCDIRTGPTSRLIRSEWAQFLQNCKGIIGAESGSYYLDRRGQILGNAKTYLTMHPTASFEEMFTHCFQNLPEHISGKAISSRHLEPIGPKTCQLLLEGHYNGILKTDRHYIGIKKGFSNIDEALDRFADDSYRDRMVQDTYEYIRAEHTYDHRVQSLIKTVTNDGF